MNLHALKRATLTVKSNRHERRLLHRSQFRTDALAASERRLTLKQRVRRLELDNWKDTVGDTSPCQ